MENDTSSGYQDQLLAELSRRKLSNPSYSLRAFARALDVSPAFLSKVLKRQKDLSTDTAASISAKLGYNDQESEQFCRLVQLGKSSSPVAKRMLSQGLESKEGSEEFHSLDLEIFQVISDWYHFAILELACCETAKLAPELASKRLGITLAEAKAAIARLVRLELLVQSRGRLIKSKSFIATPSDKPNQALRNFHSQMIEKLVAHWSANRSSCATSPGSLCRSARTKWSWPRKRSELFGDAWQNFWTPAVLPRFIN